MAHRPSSSRSGRCRYGRPDEDDDGWSDDGPLIDERRVRLNTLVEAGARRFTYLYDFGDGWEHTVKVEDLVMPNKGQHRILCIAGQNACPPEDMGGPHSYLEFVATIKDPTHDDHSSMPEQAQ